MILSLACDTILIISQEALFCYPHRFRLLHSPQHSWGIRLFIYRPERQLDTQTIERLSTCHWIEEGKNLIVTGSSASGKTYLINAFCVTAMKQSKSVKYIKANTLMSEMEQARIKSTNLDYLNRLTKLDLLVIDDFGLMDLPVC